jgi:DNA polymerase-3 subunit delta'
MDLKMVVQNQNRIFEMLKNSYKNDRLSHAYLFYGDNGVGKKEMAYALACIINCDDACLECDTCKSIIEGNHINVEYIGIEENKTMISKDQITDLQENFSKTSLVDGTRIYIVDGIDTASSQAQNSLLKFIEEPINNTPTIGIFIATELSNVVSTIISRCSLVHFKALSNDMLFNMIEEKSDLDKSLACIISNNINEINQLINSDNFIKCRDLFLEFVNLRKSKDAVIYFINNNQFFSKDNNLDMLFKWLITFIEDAILVDNNDENLIIKGICDTIISYQKNNKSTLKYKLEVVLDLYSRLRFNITAKNLLHELVIKLI